MLWCYVPSSVLPASLHEKNNRKKNEEMGSKESCGN